MAECEVSGWLIVWASIALLATGAVIGVLVASAMAAIGHAAALDEGVRRGVDAMTRPAPLDDRSRQ